LDCAGNPRWDAQKKAIRKGIFFITTSAAHEI
jgi:hypothetical protein